MNIKAIESAENEIKRLEKINGELLEACKFVKKFFDKLDDGLATDDPITIIRKRFHTPVHKILDEAIAHAEPVTDIRD